MYAQVDSLNSLIWIFSFLRSTLLVEFVLEIICPEMSFYDIDLQIFGFVYAFSSFKSADIFFRLCNPFISFSDRPQISFLF